MGCDALARWPSSPRAECPEDSDARVLCVLQLSAQLTAVSTTCAHSSSQQCVERDSPRSSVGQAVGGDVDGAHFAHTRRSDPQAAGVEAGAQHHSA
jgi:hypothetical protein